MASMLTMVHLKGAAHSNGFSASPLGSKSMMVVSGMSAPFSSGGLAKTCCPSSVTLRSKGWVSSVALLTDIFFSAQPAPFFPPFSVVPLGPMPEKKNKLKNEKNSPREHPVEEFLLLCTLMIILCQDPALPGIAVRALLCLVSLLT